MSVQSQIDRIEQNVADTYSVLNGLGATMPSVQNTDNLPETAASVKTAKPTQFTNLYDPANVVLKTNINYSSSSGLSLAADNYVNYILIPYHHKKNEPFVVRLRGIGTVRDRVTCVAFGSSGEVSAGNRVNHWGFCTSSYLDVTYDEYGDAVLTVKGSPLNYEWYYLAFNFQYHGINNNATAKTGPIITINEPIGNGGYVG